MGLTVFVFLNEAHARKKMRTPFGIIPFSYFALYFRKFSVFISIFSLSSPHSGKQDELSFPSVGNSAHWRREKFRHESHGVSSLSPTLGPYIAPAQGKGETFFGVTNCLKRRRWYLVGIVIAVAKSFCSFLG